MTKRTRPLIQSNMKMDDIRVRTIINNISKGQTNNTGEVYLVKDATTTTISDDFMTSLSMVNFTARDAVAASYNGTLWYSAVEDGRVVLHHASTSTSTVLYDYVIHG